MKKQILCAAILGIITLFSYTFANAQIDSPITTDVPFDFYVGSKKMTAGEYVIEKLSPMSSKTALSLRRKDGKEQTQMMTVPTMPSGKGDVTLLFNRYGAVSYLSEIRNPFTGFGAKLRQDKTEINLARQFGKSKRETVFLNSPKKLNTRKSAVSSD